MVISNEQTLTQAWEAYEQTTHNPTVENFKMRYIGFYPTCEAYIKQLLENDERLKMHFGGRAIGEYINWELVTKDYFIDTFWSDSVFKENGELLGVHIFSN